jgi:serine/threonine-protein kinase
MFEPGSVLSEKYRIIEQIGMGGMGAVYRARETDLDIDRSVAIKVLPPHLMADPTLVQRFHEEIKILAKLEHPNIVPVYAIGHERDCLYFVMKYLRGETLKARVRRTGAMPPGAVAHIGRQLADALDHIHRAGAIHRDIKAVNVMLDERDHATLMDFGIAKVAGGANLTAAGEVLGTAPYMAPEQWEGQTDARSDFYALGVMLYEALAGAPPFAGQSLSDIMAAHLRQPPPPLRLVRPQAPAVLTDVIHRCLEKDPGARYAVAADLLAALETAERAIPYAPAPVANPASPDAPSPVLEATVVAAPPNDRQEPTAPEESMAQPPPPAPPVPLNEDALAEADKLAMSGDRQSAYDLLRQSIAAGSDASFLTPRLKYYGNLLGIADTPPPAAATAAAPPPAAPAPAIPAAESSPAALATPATPARRPAKRRIVILAIAGPLAAILVALGLLLGGVIGEETMGEMFLGLGNHFFTNQSYVSPPLFNAKTSYNMALFYLPGSQAAAKARHNMAEYLAGEAESYARGGQTAQAAKYFGWAISIERNPEWVNKYNKLYGRR